MRRISCSVAVSPFFSSNCSSSTEMSKWSSIAPLFAAVTRITWSSPEATASSMPYWIKGLSTTLSISFGCAFVAGSMRVPNPAAGNTALRTGCRRSPCTPSGRAAARAPSPVAIVCRVPLSLRGASSGAADALPHRSPAAVYTRPPMKARLFVALPLPEEVRAGLATVQRQLDALGAPFRWVRPEGAHLTLVFLGDTDVQRLGAVEGEVAQAAAAGRRLSLVARGLGCFPGPGPAVRQYPRVLWVGLAGDTAALTALQRALELRMQRL